MSKQVEELQKHLAALDAFIESPAHTGYVVARQQEINDIQQRILLLRPIKDEDRNLQLVAFGELDSQEEMVKTFEDARQTLKARIDEMIERENELATTTKV